MTNVRQPHPGNVNNIFDVERPSDYVVWFDLDDTLWNFSGNSLEALADTYRHFALDRYWNDVDAWRHDYHVVNKYLWDELGAGRLTTTELRHRRFLEVFVGAGMDQTQAERLNIEADTYYLDRLSSRKRLVPGARHAVDILRARGFRIGILSNGFIETQRAKMRSSHLTEVIDVPVFSDEIGINKPDERLFRYAEKKAGVDAAHSIMVGDNGETDIAGALNAGWRAVWYNAAHNPAGDRLRNAIDRGGVVPAIIDTLELIFP